MFAYFEFVNYQAFYRETVFSKYWYDFRPCISKTFVTDQEWYPNHGSASIPFPKLKNIYLAYS